MGENEEKFKTNYIVKARPCHEQKEQILIKSSLNSEGFYFAPLLGFILCTYYKTVKRELFVQGHYSTMKAAATLGFGTKSVKKVKTDHK